MDLYKWAIGGGDVPAGDITGLDPDYFTKGALDGSLASNNRLYQDPDDNTIHCETSFFLGGDLVFEGEEGAEFAIDATGSFLDINAHNVGFNVSALVVDLEEPGNLFFFDDSTFDVETTTNIQLTAPTLFLTGDVQGQGNFYYEDDNGDYIFLDVDTNSIELNAVSNGGRILITNNVGIDGHEITLSASDGQIIVSESIVISSSFLDIASGGVGFSNIGATSAVVAQSHYAEMEFSGVLMKVLLAT